MLVGQLPEQRSLDHWLLRGRSELIVAHGRRRVRKIFLVENYFRDRFAFRCTGVNVKGMKVRLRVFHERLKEYGGTRRSALRGLETCCGAGVAYLGRKHRV